MNDTEKLINNNIGLVFSIARKFLNRGVEYDDLVQIGSIGLIKASEKYDETLGYKFSTYAVNLIIGEIKRFLRDDGTIKISRKLKENFIKIKYSKENLKQILNREPTLKELSLDTGIAEEDIVESLEAHRTQHSIYETVGENDEYYIIDLLKSVDNKQVEEKILVNELINKLDEKSKNVIILRYFHDCTQQQIANVMNISQVQVSRIEKAAIRKMKSYT